MTTKGKSQLKSAANAALLRLVREAVAFALPVLLWQLQNNPKWLILKPGISGLAKLLREAYPGKFNWLPL